MSIVIIGSGQAGYAVARELRRLDAGVPLVLLTRDGGESYPKPMLSVALAQGKTPAALVLASAGHMATTLDMQVVTGVEVTAIDRQARCVRTRQGDWPYRALVLATGAEPVAPALSGDGTGEVLAVMRQLAQEGMTMLVVTHEMGFARNVSSRTVFMENGVVVEEAPSQEFFAHPKEARTREFLQKISHTE